MLSKLEITIKYGNRIVFQLKKCKPAISKNDCVVRIDGKDIVIPDPDVEE